MNDIVQIDVDGARRLTERIRLTAVTVSESIDKLKSLVTQAKNSGAHTALGYESWTAYLAEVLGETPMRLERDPRKDMVGELTREGMSTRAIAAILGISDFTVREDIKAGAINLAPAPADQFDRDVAEAEAATSPPVDANPDTGEVIEPEAPRTVEGMDGKTYKVPPQRTPQRKALTDVAKDIGWELRKATDKLLRMQDDDRFTRNKNEVAAHIRGHLMFTVEACQELLDNLNQSETD